MSGFEAWAASFHGTMAIAACALVAGMILGWLAGTRPRGLSRRERRVLADRAAARAASGFRAMREPASITEALEATRAGRAYWRPPARSLGGKVHDIHGGPGEDCWCGYVGHEGEPAELHHEPPGWMVGRMGLQQTPEVAPEWEPGHVGQALAVANDQPPIYPPGDPRHDWDPSCRQRGCPVHGNWDQPDRNGDPITTGEIRAITEGMDVFMGRLLGEHPVPYPDGSGQ